MLSFSQFMNENYKNLIGPNSREKREKWVDQAWDIVQKSYAPIGGIKGSGFGSKQDMIDNLPFWKIYTKGDKLVAAAFYKDTGGRKSVAIATDGSDLGKKIVGDIFKASLGVSYGEKSGPALGAMMKIVPWEELQKFLFTPKQLEKISGKKVTLLSKFNINDLDEKDQMAYKRFPELKPYFYIRELDGELHLKVAMGTPNLPILVDK